MGSLARLLGGLHRDPRVRGHEFELVCRWFLQNDPVYGSQMKQVWLWKDWPGRWGLDAGIDLVAEFHDGSLLAVQSKAYDSAYWVTKADVDTFLSESARPNFARRLIIGTTNHIGTTATRTLHAQTVPAKYLGLSDLERAEVDWPATVADLRPRRLPRKQPRPHQTQAIEAVQEGFRTSDRGKLVMACGTGKTLVSLWIAERLRAKRTLVLFPSLTLLAQTLREWTANARKPFQILAVCSDATVYDPDAFVEHATDLDVRVTTEARVIRAFLKADGARVVFATYQSSPEVAKAMKTIGVPAFDLAIADEAHRCAGPLAGDFATILDGNSIRAKRRLFMTATPRFFTGRIKLEAAAIDYVLASMDDDEHFGPLFHELGFSEAIARSLLADYQVVIVGVNDRTYRDYAQRGLFVTTDGKKVTDARTLGAQLGLARAMKSYDLRRTVSFHSRIAAARSFSTSVPEVMAWMPARLRPSGVPWSRHISGEMASGERDALLQGFRNLGPGERGLLANARCLSEGVDVPGIDGIAFVDPRRSQIDIVQAVGRAIRNAPGKKIGTVVLPVFIETRGRPEALLEASAFKPVWDVLRALRAHDAELGEQLDSLRRGLGRRSAGALRLPSKIRLDVPIGVDARFADALRLRIVEATTQAFEHAIGELESYAAKHGHLLVPTKYTSSSGFTLGKWVANRRNDFDKGRLPHSLLKRLQSLPGWRWDAVAEQFERGVRDLREYIATHGNSSVPRGHRSGSGMLLGAWVSHVRALHLKGRLAPGQSAMLEALDGWSWDPRGDRLKRGLMELHGFIKENGHASVPVAYVTSSGFKLGHWVNGKRTRYLSRDLPRKQAAELGAIPSWIWDAREADFHGGLIELQAYAGKHGDARVPAHYRTPSGFPLGSWVATRRTQYKEGKLSAQRIASLKRVPGWTWDPLEEDFQQGLSELLMFVKANGHASPARDHRTTTGFALGAWVQNRRSEHRKRKLAPKRRQALAALPGWTWSPRATEFERGLAELRVYAQAHGHARVPQLHRTSSGFGLGHWVAGIRTAYRTKRLSAGKLVALNRISGWSWDPHDDGFRHGLEELTRFADRYQNTRVPRNYKGKGSFALGLWVNRRRDEHRRGTMAPQRAAALLRLPGWKEQVKKRSD